MSPEHCKFYLFCLALLGLAWLCLAFAYKIQAAISNFATWLQALYFGEEQKGEKREILGLSGAHLATAIALAATLDRGFW